MRDYESVLREAEAEAASGRYKEAYNVIAHAPWKGGSEDQRCRYRRGLYAYQVAHTRLDEFDKSSTPKMTLIKAGCWLSRSEAYLRSAAEDLPESEQAQIENELARTKQEQERFRQLCRDYASELFVSKDELHSAD